MKEFKNEVKYLFIDEKSNLYDEAIDIEYKEFYEKFNRSRKSIIYGII